MSLELFKWHVKTSMLCPFSVLLMCQMQFSRVHVKGQVPKSVKLFDLICSREYMQNNNIRLFWSLVLDKSVASYTIIKAFITYS